MSQEENNGRINEVIARAFQEALNREHEEIQRQKDKNPGADFAELTEKYYKKKDMHDREEMKKNIMSMRSVQKPENYLPSKVVKHRMDSEHLNEWMKRGEI